MLGEGGGERLFFFFSGGEGGRGTLLFCVYSNSFLRLRKKKLKPNSFVCLPIHSYVFPPKRSLNPNSFVCLQIHSYIFQKKTLHLNSFVCIPIHSYVFQFIRMSSRRGWWVEGGDGGWRGGERLYLFIFSRGGRGGAEHYYFVCIPMHSYVFQFIRMSSNSLGGVAPPEPGLLFRGSFVCLPIHGIGWGYPPEPLYIIISRK